MTKQIEAILSGQQSLLNINSDIDQLAQDYSSRIFTSQQDVSTPENVDFREVDIDSLEMIRPSH